MAALHTLYRTSQRLRVLACDRAGGRTAVIAPLTLIAVFPNIPFFTALGCGDKRKDGDYGSSMRPSARQEAGVPLLPECLQKSPPLHPQRPYSQSYCDSLTLVTMATLFRIHIPTPYWFNSVQSPHSHHLIRMNGPIA